MVFIAGGVLSYEQIVSGLKRADSSAVRTAGIVAHSLTLWQGKKEALDPSGSQNLNDLIGYLQGEYGYEITVVDRDRQIVGDIDEEKIGKRYAGEKHDAVGLTLTDGITRSISKLNGTSGRWIIVPVRASDGRITGAVLLNSTRALLESKRLIYRINATISVTVLLTIILSVLLASLFSRRIGGRINGLQDGVREIDRGNWDVRIDQSGNDELGALAGAFNRMASDLQASKVELDRRVGDLRESETRLRLVTLASHDMIWEMDLETGEATWSEAFWSFLGFRRGETVPTVAFWKSIIHPEDAGRVASITDSAVKNCEDSWSAEYRLRRADGRYSDIMDRAYIIYNDDKKPIRFIGAATDISEKKKAERKLAERETSFRLSFENSPHPMWVYDLQTLRFLEVNEAFLDMYGYSREELSKMTLRDIHPPEDVPRLNENLAQDRPALQHSGEWRHVRKDGSVLSVQIDSHVLEFMGRNAALVIAQDITRRKEAERKLRESEIRFRSLIERSSDVVSIIDAGGRIVYMSPAVSQMGYSAEDVTGRSAFDYVHRDDTGKMETALASISSAPGGLQTFQMRFRHSDGSWRDLESVVFNALNVPEIRGIVVNSRDITEKKKLEAQFLRAQRMESIGTLAGGIAHDLNNVLSPILLSLGVIRKMGLDKNGRMIVDTIETSARRGADLIKQVLSFARGVEGERTLVQLRYLIEEIEKIIRETFPKAILIGASAPKDLWPVSGDITQLHQVLMNLCVNARDAMPAGGKIDISAENVVLDEQYVHAHFETREGPYVVLSITDTGVGIPPGIVERIFEPFFTTKEEGKGTGLGLSTVMTIVRSHGGAVYVYSEPGMGTTFRIYLPAQIDAVAAPTDEAMKEKYAGSGEVVLVVDDEAAVRNIIKTILDAYGYKTIIAVDGEHGLEQFVEYKNDISLVITDMMMPRMDGATIVKTIRQVNPNIRIIVISGLSQNGILSSLPGVKYSLAKPFTSEMLLMTVRQALAES